ncbi:hypothetical protein ACFL27_00315 [candidate division CSSED10-310 bacterium]|uniref:Zinc ribbon domain-containing protein n=1 Tax=candidate division CSSED10-310 bacterium TaxID=2855610 RepID=A0ABV6YRA9_UNCC1
MPNCHFCGHELSAEDLTYSKCPYCFPEIRSEQNVSDVLFTKALKLEKRS